MSKDLLLELGTEEVPAHVMPLILAELKDLAAKKLAESRLDYDNIRTMGTPRRTALIVEGLSEKQRDIDTENRGPAVGIAFDENGNPTKAAEGFARGQGIAASELVTKDGYAHAIVHEAGRPTDELLPELLPELVCELKFPNSMRWGDLDFRFIRPLRWMVALWAAEIVPFELAGVRSGNVSRGHRTLAPQDFVVTSAGSYEDDCAKAFIVVDEEKRRKLICEQIEAVAKAKGGTAEITEDLLEEVLFLVEYPTALSGSFEEKYLVLPPEAVITPMRDHQRYFPVKNAAGELMPLFITVRNGGTHQLDTVAHGNERVLRARLADAQFFFDEDRKKSLMEHRERLKTVVFQQGLGSLYEKVVRLEKLAQFIGSKLGASESESQTAVRAAALSKSDLVTGMVTEFTELQGTMGREYALLDGEPREVALAIDEHYMPRFAGDGEPTTVAGQILSIADKIDNIVGTFSRGKIPTGSQDPFALRRQALGLVNLLIKAKRSLALSEVVAESLRLYGITDSAIAGKMQLDVAEFIRLRLKNVLSDMNVRYDIQDAVLTDVDDIYTVILRAQALEKFTAGGDAVEAVQAIVRVSNIARGSDEGIIDISKFVEPVESELYQSYETAKAGVAGKLAAADYRGAIAALLPLVQPINKFFEAVMVMDKDESIKRNRLALLKSIDNLTLKLADFSKIVL